MGEVWMDDLFRLRSELEVPGRTFYIRTVTAPENVDRRQYAFRMARKVWEKVGEKGTEEYGQYVEPLQTKTKEELVDQIVDRRRMWLERQAALAVKPEASPEPPAHATLSETIQAEVETDQYAMEADERRREWVDEQADVYRKQVEKKRKNRLLDDAVEAVKDAVSEAEFALAYDAYTIHCSVFNNKECTERSFASPESAGEIASWVFNRLRDAYQELDVFSQDDEALKNLPSGQE